VLTLPVVLLGFIMSQAGLAHDFGRSYIRGGIFVGGPVYWPGYYNRPYYYYPPYIYPPVVAAPTAPPPIYYCPPVVAAPAPPFASLEGYAKSADVPSQAYRYYCNDAQAYYPYVKECPGGWQQIVALPPPPPLK